LTVTPAFAQAEEAAVVVADRVVFTLTTHAAGITPAERAALVNARLERILTDPSLNPEDLRVREAQDGTMLIELGTMPVLGVTMADAAAEGSSAPEVANRWARMLREILTRVKPIYRPRDATHISFVPLLLVCLLAYLVPLVSMRSTRMPVPLVVGEIVMGIVIGRSGLGLVHYNSWLQFLAEFGFAFLMFLSGLDVDFGLLKPGGEGAGWRRNPLVHALSGFAITLVLAGLVSTAFAAMGLVTQPIMMALILSTTSLGLVVPVLKEGGHTTSLYGQSLLLSALLADFVTMFLITIVAGWLSGGFTLKLFLGLVLIAAFGLVWRLGRLLTGSGRSPLLRSQATSQVGVRGALCLMLVFVALSEQLGTEVILGAFLSGMLLSLLTRGEGSDLHGKLEALGFGFFIPIFFIMVGVRFDLQALESGPQGFLIMPLLLVAAFLIKFAAALPVAWIGTWRQTLAAGFLFSSRLSLIIAAAEISLRLGLISSSMNAAIICVALVTCIVGPTGFQSLVPPAARPPRRALVVGAGEYGLQLAGRLQRQAWTVRLLERDEAVAEAARARGFEVQIGDATDPKALEAADLRTMRALVAVSSSEAENEAACMEAGRLGVARRIALAGKSESADRLAREGVALVTPVLSTVVLLEGLVTHASVFEMLTGDAGDKRIGEAVLANPSLEGSALREMRLAGDVLVVAIERDGEVLVPNGATRLRAGDLLTLIGSEDDLREAVATVGGL
jgi:Kef-type K+ transport system membrane component KefB